MLPLTVKKEKNGLIHITFRARRLANIHEAEDIFLSASLSALTKIMEETHKVGSQMTFLTLTLSTHRPNALHVQVNGYGTDTDPRADIDILMKLAAHYQESRVSILHGLQQSQKTFEAQKMSKALRATTEAIIQLQTWTATTNNPPSPPLNAPTEDLIDSIVKGSKQNRKKAKEVQEKVKRLSKQVNDWLSVITRVSPPEEIYKKFERKMETLLQRLGKQHPHYAEALGYQERLQHNCERARRFGDTPECRAERAEIIEQLNRFALSTLGESFTEL